MSSRNTPTVCPHCGKQFLVEAYRLRDGKQPCCSSRCSAQRRVLQGHQPDNTVGADALARAEHLYKRTPYTLDKIATMTGISRGTVIKYAKVRGWKRFERETRVRTLYRRAAEHKIGRKLQPWEQVHHIDGDITNQAEDNLHVYAGPKEHTIGHKSLEACAFALYKQGVICFNHRSGTYRLK